ncbi:hypothetical protein [Peribacillus sp. SCS-155]|uniref:hypothetical protein n=1 Tax=Peribacillus sedimenti TaxID=3115297 RepID=UPI0039068048
MGGPRKDAEFYYWKDRCVVSISTYYRRVQKGWDYKEAALTGQLSSGEQSDLTYELIEKFISEGWYPSDIDRHFNYYLEGVAVFPYQF